MRSVKPVQQRSEGCMFGAVIRRQFTRMSSIAAMASDFLLHSSRNNLPDVLAIWSGHRPIIENGVVGGQHSGEPAPYRQILDTAQLLGAENQCPIFPAVRKSVYLGSLVGVDTN